MKSSGLRCDLRSVRGWQQSSPWHDGGRKEKEYDFASRLQVRLPQELVGDMLAESADLLEF